MEKKLQSQLKNADEIKQILREVEFTHTLSDGTAVNTLLVYLPIKDGKSSHDEFFDEIKKGILTNFVLSCKEIEEKLGLKNPRSPESLFKKSVNFLHTHTAQGDLGELILFTLMDVYIGAPKLISKISMKGAAGMSALGADAVHGQYIDGTFKVFLGESKLHKKFKPAARAAAKSMKSAQDKYKHELNLIDSNLDFPGITPETKAELMELLDPWADNDLSDVIHSPCFIGFTQPEIMTDEVQFIEKYKGKATDYIEDFYLKLQKKELSCDKTILLMLPFTCLKQLTAEFITYMGIANE
ncbi:protein of unknown function DUF1837 [Methylophilaceae bacterium 11]|nr:protein of unknown function DUF1837 [Methylophilaceae bacterium 11]